MQRERELKDISAKLEATSHHLEELQRRGLVSTEELKRLREKEAYWEAERRRLQVKWVYSENVSCVAVVPLEANVTLMLQDALSEAETQNARLEVRRKGLEGDQMRLQVALGEKDEEIKVNSFSKCFVNDPDEPIYLHVVAFCATGPPRKMR